MLKKLSIFLFAALALGFTSCEEDWVEPTPQSNPQEPTMSLEGLTVDYGQALKGTEIDLTAADSIEVITTTATPELRAGQEVGYMMYMSKNADFSDARPMVVTNGKVPTSAININYRDLFGKTPKANNVYFRFAAFLNYADGAAVRFGDTNTFFATTGAINVTPIPESFTVEEEYYLVGDMNGWNINAPTKLNHSDKDVYDDPYFTITVQVGDNCCWKVVPKSSLGNWDGVWGVAVDGDVSTKGKLINNEEYKKENDKNVGAAKIPVAGWYRITINMMDNEYKVEALGDPYIYIIGNNNGWKFDNGDYPLVSPEYDNVYTGIYQMPGNCYMRFYSALGNDKVGSIGSDADGSVNVNAEFTNGVFNAPVVVDGKGCFVIPEAGTYYFKVDLNANSVYLNKVDPAKIYVVGNCNGWEPTDASCALMNESTNGDSYIYSGEVMMKDSSDGKSYFRFNTALSWDSQMGSVSGANEDLVFAEGAATSKLVFGSGGCYVVDPGMYFVTVNLMTGEVTLVALE
ncbi:MAG: hypothetical protein ACI4AN_01565 [Muribaculaceae bacterium]